MSLLDLPVLVMFCPHVGMRIDPRFKQHVRDTVTVDCAFCGDGLRIRDDRRLRS